MAGKKSVVLHCINSLGVGGAEVLLRDTITGMPEFDHVICYLNKPEDLLPDFKNYSTYNLGHSGWKNSFRTISRMKKIIRQHNPDVIHSHLFEVTVLSRLATSKNDNFFFTIHNIMSKDAFEVNRMSVFAERVTYKKRHTIIGVSQQALNDYNKWIGIKGKSFVLYNYVKQSFFDASYDYNRDIQNAFKLVAVGNLRRQKNYFALLEAIHLLKDHPIHLDIYGSGDLEKELLDKINKERLNVRLMGRTNDVSAVLPAYHAYIMPSLFEGFGIAPMEAMAAGMPVLLSNLEVFKEVAEDFPVYFDPANPSTMADAIKYAYDNWQQVKSKAQKGKSMIKQKVSREVYFSNLIKIYNS